MAITSVRLELENFRVLERLDWQMSDVCLLSAPNGSGKSTVLDALRFLSVGFLFNHQTAFQAR